jgi:hypothetical protein
MKQKIRFGAIGLALSLIFWPAVANAQRIVLLRPKTADPALLQAFGRLQGELTVHHFEVVVVDAAEDAPTPRELAQAAERVRAVATVSLIRTDGLASADVWISDRVTGKTSMRTIATDQRSEAASVLAIRAVDLLRASLREFGPGEPPPPDVVGASPERAPEHVRRWATVPPAREALSVEAGAVMQSTLSPLGSLYGPSVSLGYAPAERTVVRATFQGLLFGGHASAGGASLSLANQQLFVELGYRVLSRAAWSLEIAAAIGAHHLEVEGTASPPYVGRSDSAWTALAAGGVGVEFSLSRTAAFFATGRAIVLAPRPVARFANVELHYGRPALQAGAGLRVHF